MIQANPLSDLAGWKQLLSFAQGGEQEPSQQAVEYDWKTPCRFTRRQREALDATATGIAAQLSRRVSDQLKMEVKLLAGAAKQFYVSDLAAQVGPAAKYYVSLLGASGAPCGWAALSAECASAWVSRLLGGCATGPATARDLSRLETALLMDVLTSVTEAASEVLAKGAGKIARQDALLDASALAGCADGEEFVQFGFALDKDPAKLAVILLLASDVAETQINDDSGKKAARPAAEIQKDLQSHVEGTEMQAAVIVGDTKVAMKDILALEAGDVLILPTGPGDLVDLLVQGKPVLKGMPVSCEGSFAIQVTGLADKG